MARTESTEKSVFYPRTKMGLGERILRAVLFIGPDTHKTSPGEAFDAACDRAKQSTLLARLEESQETFREHMAARTRQKRRRRL
ncbi:hypothetical protein [uncultured Tateyamaria sp.]|uniref:hypothetical protein n=1 Tax=uncultured Tateyamaria sp. TaxID=455651 RepID=UPI00260B6644|nr:hypothetical protein [uncultured Tateyamaria sp.]